MGTLSITRNTIECDGCGTVFGTPAAFPNGMEARASAFGEGWRFPNQISTKDGRRLASTSDVCPACLPSWIPRHPQLRVRNVGQAEWEAHFAQEPPC